jgi:hypothetical protein
MRAIARGALWSLCWLAIAYVVSSIVIFDFFGVAHPGDEDNTADGKPVAIGPMPRKVFCRPTVHDVDFNGDEWPFKWYAPICKTWRMIRGFAPPAEERHHR